MVTASPEELDPPDAAKVGTIAAAAIGVLLTAGALAIYGGRTGASVAVGALMAVANLLTLTAIIRAVIRPPPEEERAEETETADETLESGGRGRNHADEGRRGGGAWAIFAVGKIVVLFGGLWILLTQGVVDPMPLTVGYGVLPLGITAGGLLSSLLPRSSARGRRDAR